MPASAGRCFTRIIHCHRNLNQTSYSNNSLLPEQDAFSSLHLFWFDDTFFLALEIPLLSLCWVVMLNDWRSFINPWLSRSSIASNFCLSGMNIKLLSWCILLSAYLLFLSCPSRSRSFSSLLSVLWIFYCNLCFLFNPFVGYCSACKINILWFIASTVDWLIPITFLPRLLDFAWVLWITC